MSILKESHEGPLWPGNTTICYLAAVLAFTSQAIHLWILPETFVLTVVPGLFFLLVGIGQGLLGVSLLFGPSRWALRLGILLNFLVVAIWIITRIVSLPALTGSANLTIGTLGIVATLTETALILFLIKLLANRI